MVVVAGRVVVVAGTVVVGAGTVVVAAGGAEVDEVAVGEVGVGVVGAGAGGVVEAGATEVATPVAGTAAGRVAKVVEAYRSRSGIVVTGRTVTGVLDGLLAPSPLAPGSATGASSSVATDTRLPRAARATEAIMPTPPTMLRAPVVRRARLAGWARRLFTVEAMPGLSAPCGSNLRHLAYA